MLIRLHPAVDQNEEIGASETRTSHNCEEGAFVDCGTSVITCLVVGWQQMHASVTERSMRDDK